MSEFISVADVCPTGFAREQKEVRDEVAESPFVFAAKWTAVSRPTK